MITPKFYLVKKANGTATVYVYFYINREKVNFSTKIICEPANWDDNKMCLKKSDRDNSDKNIVIENIRSRINNVFVKYRLKDRKITREIFLKNYNKPSDYDTFHDYCEVVIRRTRSKLEVNTYRMHKSVLKKLKEYHSTLHFDDIDGEFIENYKRYLTQKLANNLNTTYKNLAVIRKYVRYAIREGYIEINPFAEISVNRCKTNIVFLTDDELKKLCDEYNSKNYEEKHKTTFQCFLFMCFGSQHIGDARAMKIEQFGPESFTYFRKKTRNRKPEPVTVPISTSLRKLVNELCDGREKGYLLQKLPAEQTMNEYLKTIADNAGISKKISHKTGRHTFATIYLQNNPNLKLLQEILGHSDMKTTMMYVHAMEKYASSGIDCFNKFL